MAEWLKAAVLKTARRASVSWVQIPPRPPPCAFGFGRQATLAHRPTCVRVAPPGTTSETPSDGAHVRRLFTPVALLWPQNERDLTLPYRSTKTCHVEGPLHDNAQRQSDRNAAGDAAPARRLGLCRLFRFQRRQSDLDGPRARRCRPELGRERHRAARPLLGRQDLLPRPEPGRANSPQ